MPTFNKPMFLVFEEPCTITNWCWVSKTFYGEYYISHEDCKYHAGIDLPKGHWESLDHLNITEAIFACYDKHCELIKTCYDEYSYYTYI
jgi:hypothetical protein